MEKVILTGRDITIDQVWQVAHNKVPVEFCSKAKAAVEKSRSYIENRIEAGDIMYGVNTGFGAFSSVSISEEKIHQLQINLIRSHCSGVGEHFSPEESRAVMFLRANALATGLSGCRPEAIEKLIEFLNKDICPAIPKQGSVGASGDLAPLAHLALALIGEGEVWQDGKIVEVVGVLKKKKIDPLVLEAKEGLSLINGCQVMTAIGLLYCYRARDIVKLLDLAGAMTTEALQGSRSAFDPIIPPTRPHPGEALTVQNMNNLLGDSSAIGDSHVNCDRVQDPYSLRCIPAVHGAARDTLRRTIETLEIEANSSTDNPLVFCDENKILSCGNFHGEPVAFALDFLCIAMSAASSISECRIAKMINPAMSNGLPAFLTKEGGINSGMMIVQVAAASLVSENKILSHPASVDSIPTSADKEDHVSMGTIAARKLGKIIKNAQHILAMELLCANQAMGFLKPLEPAAGVKYAYDFISKRVPFAEEDRVFAKDIKIIEGFIESRELISGVQKQVGQLNC